jgi:hypothetical protein
MMRLTGCIACAIVAFNCAEKAVGYQPQELFAADVIWVWWVPALFWMIGGLRILAGEAA